MLIKLAFVLYLQASNVSIANMSIQEVSHGAILNKVTVPQVTDSSPFTLKSMISEQYKDMSGNAEVYDAGQ